LKRMYIQKLQEEEKTGSTDLFGMATRYIFVGQNARALDTLEKAYAEHNIMLPLLKTEPSFAALHSELRFQELARKLALP
jgi:hypothetical protein